MKIIKMVLLLIFFPLALNAQTLVFECNSYRVLRWNKHINKYEFKEEITNTVLFKFDGNGQTITATYNGKQEKFFTRSAKQIGDERHDFEVVDIKGNRKIISVVIKEGFIVRANIVMFFDDFMLIFNIKSYIDR